MAILVLTQPQPPQPIVAALRQALPGETLFEDLASAQARADTVEAIVLWRLPPGLLAGFPRLRFLAASAAGVDKILGPEVPATLPVTRTVDPGQNLQIAQYACAMVLRHTRELPRYEAQQRDRAWTRHPVTPPDAVTVGLLGLGESGRVVAAALLALGFRVAGWSRTPRALPGVDCLHGPQGLRQLLPRCQVLVCLLPLTAQTQGLIDADLLAALPRGACVINLARGGHVVEPDLVAALRAGHLGGAVLDVQSREPLPPDDPLWAAPGLLVTPHIASLPTPATIAGQIAENLLRARRGDALLRVVDRTLGY